MISYLVKVMFSNALFLMHPVNLLLFDQQEIQIDEIINSSPVL